MPRETFLLAGGPQPEIKQPHKDDAAQRLLTWLQRWPKPTISSRDIRIWGPMALRDREIATNSIEVLIRHGWLVPTKTRQRNYRILEIVRKGPIVHPTVAT
jgi:hypothetical protein